MSDLLTRAAAFFITPAAIAPEREVSSPPRFAPRALVLGTPREAPPVAAALGNELRRANRWPAALVAIWSPTTDAADALPDRHTSAAASEPRLSAATTTADGASPATGAAETANGTTPADRDPQDPRRERPAHAAARRLATRLASRGLPATARGRLAWLPLPADAGPGLAMAERAAATIDVPAVLALAGPRPAEAEPLLAEHDLVAVVAGDRAGPLTTLALDHLSGLSAPSVAVRPLRGASRRLALAGVGGLRSLADASIRDAVRGLA
jgi:hypothetical protein